MSEFTKFAFNVWLFHLHTMPNAPVSFVVNLLPLLSYSAPQVFFSDFKMGLNPAYLFLIHVITQVNLKTLGSVNEMKQNKCNIV